MPKKRSLLVLLLLIGMTGCPTFGPDGAITMALHKDMVNLHVNCRMSGNEWRDKCGNDYWRRSPEQRGSCPRECRPARPQQE